MSSLNILKNDIGTAQAQALIKIKQEKKMTTLCGLNGDETELNLSGKMNGAEDALMLVEDIKDNWALSSLNVLGNSIGQEQMLSLIKSSEQQGLITQFCLIPIKELKENTITELDMSGKNLGVDGAVVLATYLKDNGTLSKFTFSGELVDSKPVTVEVGMTELDCSGALLRAAGATILAAWIQHK